MVDSFARWPDAVPTTLEVAEQCNVEMTLGELLLPRYPTEDGSEPSEMLRRIATEGCAASTETRRPPRRSNASSTSSG